MVSMQKITREDAIQYLSDAFKIGSGLSEIRGDRIYICKFDYPREEVIKTLTEYFSDKCFCDGWSLYVEPIEYIFTEIVLEKK